MVDVDLRSLPDHWDKASPTLSGWLWLASRLARSTTSRNFPSWTARCGALQAMGVCKRGSARRVSEDRKRA